MDNGLRLPADPSLLPDRKDDSGKGFLRRSPHSGNHLTPHQGDCKQTEGRLIISASFGRRRAGCSDYNVLYITIL